MLKADGKVWSKIVNQTVPIAVNEDNKRINQHLACEQKEVQQKSGRLASLREQQICSGKVYGIARSFEATSNFKW